MPIPGNLLADESDREVFMDVAGILVAENQLGLFVGLFHFAVIQGVFVDVPTCVCIMYLAVTWLIC